MNNVIKWDPFAELSALQKQFFGDDFMTPFTGINIPTTDVYTKGNNIVVEAHLPNFEEKDMSIEVDDNALVISADRYEKEQDKDKKYVVRESSSSFYRRVALPEQANADKVKARLDDGVLKVSIPLTALPEPKKIAIASKSKK